MIRPHRLRRAMPGALLWMLACGACAAAHAAEFELPALNSPPSAEHHPGKMIWADLVTPDLAAAERFYGGLFGWNFQSFRAGSSDYAVAMVDGSTIGGLMAKQIMTGVHQQ